ncbi:MAG: ATP-dependent zinc metalloprotease FtsH [Cellvibrionaceae bacterium]
MTNSEDQNKNTGNHSDPVPPKAPHPFDAHTLIWFMMVFAVYSIFSGLSSSKTTEISYTEFKNAIDANQVATVTFKGDQILGVYVDGEIDKPKEFRTVLPATADADLLPLLEEHDVNIVAKSSSEPQWFQILIGIVPWLLILAFFVYSSRMLQQRMGGGGGKDGLFGFSKSKARLFETKDNEIGYDDVAGVEGAKQDLQEIIDFLKNPDEFKKLGAKMPRGILLMGPPGTGKTMLAKATAHEAGVPFFSISGSEFIEMFVGVGASRVRDMFKEARSKAPSLIFVDEIDSVGRVRGTGLGGGNDEREQTLNQILAEMDGFTADEAVVVLAATNRPDVLDPALLRPGRFDRKVTLELPQQNARIEILKVHTRKVPIALDVNLKELASMTVGFSGADLANLVNEAALSAARKKADIVTRDDFNQAHDKVIMGSERKDLLNPSERKRTAVHESGHAIAALFLPNSDPLRQVSIIPRGRALGATEQLPQEDRHNYTQSYIETRLSVMLGGRVAEKIVLDDMSSGASNDLEQATHLAKMMVTQWGMSDTIGPIHFKVGTEHPFLGYEIQQEKDFSEETAKKIDQEIHRIIKEAEQKTIDVLLEHRGDLDKLVEALLSKETLDLGMIEEIIGKLD